MFIANPSSLSPCGTNPLLDTGPAPSSEPERLAFFNAFDAYKVRTGLSGDPDVDHADALWRSERYMESIQYLEQAVAGRAVPSRAHATLLLFYRNLSLMGKTDGTYLQKSVLLARLLGNKTAEFYSLADTFSFSLTKINFGRYMPWMQIVRIFRPHDKSALYSAIKLIPEVLPEHPALVAEYALKLLAHPLNADTRRFAREVIAPKVKECQANDRLPGFSGDLNPLFRRLLNKCGVS